MSARMRKLRKLGKLRCWTISGRHGRRALRRRNLRRSLYR